MCKDNDGFNTVISKQQLNTLIDKYLSAGLLNCFSLFSTRWQQPQLAYKSLTHFHSQLPADNLTTDDQMQLLRQLQQISQSEEGSLPYYIEFQQECLAHIFTASILELSVSEFCNLLLKSNIPEHADHAIDELGTITTISEDTIGLFNKQYCDYQQSHSTDDEISAYDKVMFELVNELDHLLIHEQPLTSLMNIELWFENYCSEHSINVPQTNVVMFNALFLKLYLFSIDKHHLNVKNASQVISDFFLPEERFADIVIYMITKELHDRKLEESKNSAKPGIV